MRDWRVPPEILAAVAARAGRTRPVRRVLESKRRLLCVRLTSPYANAEFALPGHHAPTSGAPGLDRYPLRNPFAHRSHPSDYALRPMRLCATRQPLVPVDRIRFVVRTPDGTFIVESFATLLRRARRASGLPHFASAVSS